MMVVTALKMPANISLSRSWQPPAALNWAGFPEAVGRLRFNLINSPILAISATIISTVLGSINGYVFSKWKLISSEIVFTLFFFGIFIPY
jgi:glucose/mannose transport system permease protein